MKIVGGIAIALFIVGLIMVLAEEQKKKNFTAGNIVPGPGDQKTTSGPANETIEQMLVRKINAGNNT